MIRKIHIDHLVLDLYKQLPKIVFPISMSEIFKIIPKCQCMSYQKFARITGCTVDDVILLCKSKSGCTHYDTTTNRYLALINSDQAYNNPGRLLWTAAHEAGHIMCQHHIISTLQQIAENSFGQIPNTEYEMEADYFAATLLAPLPFLKLFKVKTTRDIQNEFGLSAKAATIRLREYKKWLKNHKKTAWENDIVNLYKQKGSLCQ